MIGQQKDVEGQEALLHVGDFIAQNAKKDSL
jgi:hypothetical protein